MAIPDVQPADVAKGVLAFVDQFEARDGWSLEMLDEELAKWLEKTGWKVGNAKGLLRVAVTGRKSSPEISQVMLALGKEVTRRRLRRAAEFVGSGGKAK
jgi:glutamyl/glutaminyl-tRNA synthetase